MANDTSGEGAHTPTPWQCDCGPYARQPRIYSVSLNNRLYKLIAEVGNAEAPLTAQDEWEANAAFIVRACNSHDELVAALTDAIETIKALHGPVAWDIYEQHAPEMKRYRAARSTATDKTGRE